MADYPIFWVDGIHVQARLEDDAQCLLVIIGATPEGKKELVGLIDGVRESAQSWKELLLDLKRRGLAMGPELAVADGALGFWKALPEVWPKTREQRCWVHKTANVLNRLPKSLQGKAKRALQNIWMAETRKDAEAAFDTFAEIYGTKYDKAVECLTKDRDVLLAFYDFPAEHGKHLRTTNPIESTFATVRSTRLRVWRGSRPDRACDWPPRAKDTRVRANLWREPTSPARGRMQQWRRRGERRCGLQAGWQRKTADLQDHVGPPRHRPKQLRRTSPHFQTAKGNSTIWPISP
jgi:transposase-like protein